MNTVITIPLNNTEKQANEYVNMLKNIRVEDIWEFKGQYYDKPEKK